MIISPGNNTDRRKKNPLHRRRLDRPRLTLLKVSCFVGHLGAIFFHRKLIKYRFQSVLPPLTQENHSTNQMCQVIAEQTQSFFHNYRLACDCCTAMIEDRNTEVRKTHLEYWRILSMWWDGKVTRAGSFIRRWFFHCWLSNTLLNNTPSCPVRGLLLKGSARFHFFAPWMQTRI